MCRLVILMCQPHELIYEVAVAPCQVGREMGLLQRNERVRRIRSRLLCIISTCGTVEITPEVEVTPDCDFDLPGHVG